MMNPYTHQIFLFVPNSERAALGQFFRDYGDELEGFANGEDANMLGVSTDGLGPPDGWCFASWVTEAQGAAFIAQQPNMPAGTRVVQHVVGSRRLDEWLATFGMQRIVENG
jgi:hypothetical protein